MSYVTFRVVIPARLKSSRLPNKPLLDLGGKPMIVRVCERAQRSGADTIVVATVAGMCAMQFGKPVLMCA